METLTNRIQFDEKPRVIVVSAFGRGNWLAAELVTLGFESHLVDVSEELGRWAPEDWEGPFGYFQTDSMTQSQRARLDTEDYAEAIEDGFVLWLKSGPLDLRGSHSQYLLESREIGADVKEYILNYDRLPEKRRKELRAKLHAKPFRENWFAALAHAFASPVSSSSYEYLSHGRPASLFSPYFVRRVSRRGLEKSLAWVKSCGASVYQKAKLKDLSIDSQQALSVEINSDWSGVIHAQQFVWALSSQETERVNPSVSRQLFTAGPAPVEWVWLRYRVNLQCAQDLNETLPLKFAVIEDLALPWTHENFLMVQKTTIKETCDVWAKAPATLRFQKDYIEDLGRKLLRILAGRVPQSQPIMVDLPQDHVYDESVLGPSRFGVYSQEALAKLKRKNLENIHYDGPEVSEMHDWDGQFLNQKNIFENIKTWKLERDRKIEKMKAREQKNAAQDSEGPPT